MKKLLVCFLLVPVLAFADMKVFDSQVRVDTNSFTLIDPVTNTLDSVLTWLDGNIVMSTNLVNRPTTNWVVSTITNTVYAYFATNITYPLTNSAYTPRYVGDTAIITNDVTNVIYRAVGTRTNDWKKIYGGTP